MRASTRPYFLFRMEMSKNSSWLSDCIKLTVCCSSSKFSRSICPFSRLATNSVKYSTSCASAETPWAFICFTSCDSGRAWVDACVRADSNGCGWCWTPYQDLVCCVAQCIKIDQLLDFSRQAKQRGVHDIGQVSGQRLHVIAWLCRHIGRQPAERAMD